jgi:hypothetical protein
MTACIACRHACIHACMRTCIHAYVHTNICVHTLHVCIHAIPTETDSRAKSAVRVSRESGRSVVSLHDTSFAYEHTYMHTYIHRHMHTYIHHKIELVQRDLRFLYLPEILYSALALIDEKHHV